jgi:SAM-dependent methyltransferase
MEESWDLRTIDRIKNVDKVRSAPERIVPPYTSAEPLAEHAARYKWAAERISGRVLDLGCGVGYGGQILLSTNGAIEEVVGVDISTDALEFAIRTYASKYLHFIQGDACRLPFSDYSFDTVVCFEAIEHVKEPVSLFKEVKRILRPGGTFLVSTPNRYLTSPFMPSPLNPHHKREWYPNQFFNLVQQHFMIAALYGQNWYPKKIFFHVFFNVLKTRLKVVLDRLGMFYPLQRVYRAFHPYRSAPARASVEVLFSKFMPRPLSQKPGLLPGVVIVETART